MCKDFIILCSKICVSLSPWLVNTFYHTEYKRTSRFSGKGGHCSTWNKCPLIEDVFLETGTFSSHALRGALQI